MKIILKTLFIIIFSIVLLIFSYKWSNNSLTNGEEEKLITKLALFITDFTKNRVATHSDLENIVCINISNDKELVTVTDILGGIDTGMPKGKKDITNREKIAKFLIKANNKHKFIMLDVDFDSKYQSPNDSLLQLAFDKTHNIITPIHFSKIGDLKGKNFNVNSGFSAYKKSIFSNRFLKYQFLQNDTIESFAYKVSKSINNTHIIKDGLYYYDDGKLCLNSIILNFYIKPIKKFDENNFQQFKELGVDVLGEMSNDEIEKLVKNKIVLIGDFDDRDMHISSYGKIQGVLINYNAYLSLKKNKHIIPNSLKINLLLLYLLITSSILFNIDKLFIYKLKYYFLDLKKVIYIKSWINKFKVFVVISSFVKNIFNHIFNNYIKVATLIISMSVLFYLI
jgi:hypothetical protein